MAAGGFVCGWSTGDMVIQGSISMNLEAYETPNPLTTQDWFELSAIRNLTNGCWWAGWFEILACLDESYHSIF